MAQLTLSPNSPHVTINVHSEGVTFVRSNEPAFLSLKEGRFLTNIEMAQIDEDAKSSCSHDELFMAFGRIVSEFNMQRLTDTLQGPSLFHRNQQMLFELQGPSLIENLKEILRTFYHANDYCSGLWQEADDNYCRQFKAFSLKLAYNALFDMCNFASTHDRTEEKVWFFSPASAGATFLPYEGYSFVVKWVDS